MATFRKRPAFCSRHIRVSYIRNKFESTARTKRDETTVPEEKNGTARDTITYARGKFPEKKIPDCRFESSRAIRKNLANYRAGKGAKFLWYSGNEEAVRSPR